MHNEYLLPLYVVLTFVITAFAVMTTVLLIVNKQRQVRNRIERQRLEHEHATALMVSKLEMQERAMQAVSEEIHDNFGQVLSFCRMQFAALRSHLATDMGVGLLNEGLDQMKKSIKDLRLLSHSLNTGLVEKRDLEDAINTELERLEAFAGLECSLQSTGDRPEITPDARVLLFRIVQESLQNVVKHAKAAAVFVRLHYTPDTMVLEIRDDGVGFDVRRPGLESSLGMGSMQQRAAMLRSRAEVISRIGAGTTIRMTIPLTNNICQPHPHHQQQEALQFA